MNNNAQRIAFVRITCHRIRALFHVGQYWFHRRWKGKAACRDNTVRKPVYWFRKVYIIFLIRLIFHRYRVRFQKDRGKPLKERSRFYKSRLKEPFVVPFSFDGQGITHKKLVPNKQYCLLQKCFELYNKINLDAFASTPHGNRNFFLLYCRYRCVPYFRPKTNRFVTHRSPYSFDSPPQVWFLLWKLKTAFQGKPLRDDRTGDGTKRGLKLGYWVTLENTFKTFLETLNKSHIDSHLFCFK